MTSTIMSYIPRHYGTTKAAVAALICAAGGLREAAALSGRVGKSRLQAMTDPNNDSSHAPVDLIEKLEQATGCHAITEHLAAKAGYLLLPMTAAKADEPIACSMAKLGDATAGLFREFSQALADDQKVDASEAAEMLREGDRVAREWARLRVQLAAKLEPQREKIPA